MFQPIYEPGIIPVGVSLNILFISSLSSFNIFKPIINKFNRFNKYDKISFDSIPTHLQ